MSINPNFIGVPKCWRCRTTLGNTTPDASTTTNLVSLIPSPGASGSRVERVNITHAPATDTAASITGILRFYLYDGSNYALAKELAVTAITRSATAIGTTAEWSRTDGQPVIIIPSGFQLFVGSEAASIWDWIALGGDY